MENTPLVPPSAQEPGVPSRKQQEWGALISMIIIVLMIVIGAFYAWGKRVSQNTQYVPASSEVNQ